MCVCVCACMRACLRARVEDEQKMVLMLLDCETAEVAQSSGQAELGDLGPGTGDKGLRVW